MDWISDIWVCVTFTRVPGSKLESDGEAVQCCVLRSLQVISETSRRSQALNSSAPPYGQHIIKCPAHETTPSRSLPQLQRYLHST